jgi:hypothetical protein
MERVARPAAELQEHSPESRGTRELRELRERCPVQPELPLVLLLLAQLELPQVHQLGLLPEEDPLRAGAPVASRLSSSGD